jgi:hypothetical protein
LKQIKIKMLAIAHNATSFMAMKLGRYGGDTRLGRALVKWLDELTKSGLQSSE